MFLEFIWSAYEAINTTLAIQEAEYSMLLFGQISATRWGCISRLATSSYTVWCVYFGFNEDVITLKDLCRLTIK